MEEKQCGDPFGTIDYEGTCQRLLTRGPCSNEEWLVKDKNSFRGRCLKRLCHIGQLQFSGRCVAVSDRTVCSEGQMLYVDFTGEVHCDCEPGYFYDLWRGQCFTQYDRGFCNFGQYLLAAKNGEMNCALNPCLMEGFAFYNETRKCYRKMFRGVCESPDSLAWHRENSTVECIASSVHSVFDVPTLKSCPPGSVRDIYRRCREEFRVPVDIIYPASYGHCRLGFVKDARGICRRTHKLFG
ncbi:hypothetical protein SK128_019484 [Halocaridina rubra]|uniref:DUF4789 domain-containing protein n=1 Tax=Halocaridina rubra TaxID=373956 RepID=A0AAN8X2S3_HALRR